MAMLNTHLIVMTCANEFLPMILPKSHPNSFFLFMAQISDPAQSSTQRRLGIQSSKSITP
jgi:hypothetical protein